MANEFAPAGQIYVCAACGKRSHDRYGTKLVDQGWDESCMLHAVLCDEATVTVGKDGRVTAKAVTTESKAVLLREARENSLWSRHVEHKPDIASLLDRLVDALEESERDAAALRRALVGLANACIIGGPSASVEVSKALASDAGASLLAELKALRTLANAANAYPHNDSSARPPGYAELREWAARLTNAVGAYNDLIEARGKTKAPV